MRLVFVRSHLSHLSSQSAIAHSPPTKRDRTFTPCQIRSQLHLMPNAIALSYQIRLISHTITMNENPVETLHATSHCVHSNGFDITSSNMRSHFSRLSCQKVRSHSHLSKTKDLLQKSSLGYYGV